MAMNPPDGSSGSVAWRTVRGALARSAASAGRYGSVASPAWSPTAPRASITWASVASVSVPAGPPGARNVVRGSVAHATTAAARARMARDPRGGRAPKRLNPVAS